MKLDMIGLTTADMAASLKFYALLGVDVPELPDNEPYAECTLPNGLRISWNTVELMKKVTPDWEEPRGQRMTLAFLCDSPDEVNTVFARVVEAGFTGEKEPWDAFWGQRYAIVKDPDGNHVDLFAPLETAP